MERGIRRSEIFLDEFDNEIFKEILSNEVTRHNCKIHAYCMMTNHFHLLLETDDTEVGKFMKALAGKYAMYFNHRYSYRGHVFEGRYRSCLVETDQYFLQTSRYIHLNPVKAKIVANPEDYPWSSYKTFLRMADDRLTERDKTLAYFGKHGTYGYRQFVEDIGKKYFVDEENIRKSMMEDELWLPW